MVELYNLLRHRVRIKLTPQTVDFIELSIIGGDQENFDVLLG